MSCYSYFEDSISEPTLRATQPELTRTIDAPQDLNRQPVQPSQSGNSIEADGYRNAQ